MAGDVLLPSREEDTLVVNPLGDPVFGEETGPAGEPGEL